MNIAIVGATGNVGRKLLEVIEKLNFQFGELYLLPLTKVLEKKLLLKIKAILLLALVTLIFLK